MADPFFQRFFRELKRRKVFRVAAAYAAAAWVATEVVATVAPLLELPGWLPRAVVVLLVAGFPVVVALAWAFQLTSEGVRREDGTGGRDAPPEEGRGPDAPGASSGAAPIPAGWRILMVGAVAIVAGTVGAFLVSSGERDGDLVADRIAVLPFENRTGDPQFDPVGRLAADWITQGISRAGIGRAMPLSDVLQTFGPGEEPAELAPAEAAEATGARTLVVGSYYRVGDELQFQARVLDARDDALIDAVDPVTADPSDPRDGIERLRQRVTGVLATIFDPREVFDGGSRDVVSRPPTLDAYEAFAQGMDRFLRFDFAEAAPLFLRAGELDPTFQRATLRALEAYVNLQQWEKVDSLTAALSEVRSELTLPDRLLLEAYEAHAAHDRDLAIDRMGRLAEMFPNSYFVFAAAWHNAADNRPQRALRYVRSVDPTRGPMSRWIGYWGVYTKAHHLLGEYESELEVAERAQEEYAGPEELLRPLRVPPLAALGRFGALRAAVRRAVSTGNADPAGLLTLAAAELEAHGHADTASAYRAEALARLEELGEEERRRRRGLRVELLYRAGRHEAAREVVEAMLAEAPEPVDGRTRARVVGLRGRLGTIAARQGDVEEARRIEEWLGSLEWPHMSGDPALWRARIAVALGEHGRAVSLLRRGLEEADFTLSVHRDADFMELRDRADYQSVLEPRGRP